ncbi:MAG: helix-turn-helix domain-containing protein [Pirellulaceae bacterium]|nr:helix-turn-helix domain-containing protein [Pirellulaceae bacterium]
METKERLLTAKDLASYLGLSLPETYKLLQSGAITHYRVGPGRGAIRIRESDIESFLEKRKKGPSDLIPPPRRAKPSVLKHIKK